MGSLQPLIYRQGPYVSGCAYTVMSMASPPPVEPEASTARPLHTIDRVVPVSGRRILRRTLVTGLIFSTLLAGLVLIYYRAESANNLDMLKSGRERIQHLATLTLHQEMAAVLSDLRYLSRHNELFTYLETGGPAAERQLGEEYVHFLAQKRDYDQARLIDLDGQERIRVNQTPGGADSVPSPALQNKKDRYYFTELMKLGPGQIYVSPLDLNVEQGAVEQPLKPMIRFGMAVFDQEGRKRGLLVLNYRADRLINRIHLIAGAPRNLWLLNGEGFWLMGPDGRDEWGFMFPERRERRFSLRYPETWRQMQQTPLGAQEEGGLLLQFQRVFPLAWYENDREAPGLARPVARDRYYWNLVTVISGEERQALDAPLIQRLAMIYAVLALFSFAVAGALSWLSSRNLALVCLLERMVDNVPMLVAYVDAGQRYRFNNMAYRDWFGSTPRQLYGRRLRDVMGESTYQALRPTIEKVLAGQRVDCELRLDFDGTGPRDVTVSYLPDVVEGGGVRGYYAVVNDITALKETQRRERQHLLELAHVSRLASVGEVTTEIAHQVNQPLAAIAMFSAAALRTLRDGGEPDQVMDWLGQINAQAQRAGEVVKRLRRFAHRGETSRGPVSLNELAREVVALTEYGARSLDVEVRLSLAAHLPTTPGDRVLLEQVIYNLVRNAMEAVAEQPGPRRVEIRTSSEDAGVCLEVADTGPGIAESLGQGVFDSFITKKPHGLGIGLAISRSIIEAHGGIISYTSPPEGGTVFRFTLPGVHREQ